MSQNITLLEFKLLTRNVWILHIWSNSQFPHQNYVWYWIAYDLGRMRGSVIKFPLHSGTAWGGINKAVEHKLWFCPMLSCLNKSFADTGKDRLGGYHWSLVIRSWGSIVLVMRHIFAQFQNLAVEQSVTFAADNNSLSWSGKIVSSIVVSAKLHLTHKILLDGCLLKQVVDPCLLSWWCFLFFWWIALKEVKDMDNTLRQ